MICRVFEKVYANFVANAGYRIFDELVPALDANGDVISNQWYCGHGLIAVLPGPDGMPAPQHNVDPSMVGKTFEVTKDGLVH